MWFWTSTRGWLLTSGIRARLRRRRSYRRLSSTMASTRVFFAVCSRTLCGQIRIASSIRLVSTGIRVADGSLKDLAVTLALDPMPGCVTLGRLGPFSLDIVNSIILCCKIAELVFIMDITTLIHRLDCGSAFVVTTNVDLATLTGGILHTAMGRSIITVGLDLIYTRG